ncbi:MAG: PocR ligand-binding domain-containing protein [Treponema sp.]|nr:PocR ligand-binding domain-containing protein [Treponema sp.]
MLKFTITDLLDPDSLQIIQEGFSRFTGLNALVTDTTANPVTEGNDFSDFISKILVYNEDANEPVIKKEIAQILRSGKTITLKNDFGSLDAASPLLLEGDLIGLFICGAGSDAEKNITEAQVVHGSKFLATISEALSQMAYTSNLSLNNSHAMQQSALSASAAVTETALKMKQSMQEWVEVMSEALESNDLELIKKQVEQILETGTDVYTAVSDSVQNIQDKIGSTHLVETEYSVHRLVPHYVEQAKKVMGQKSPDFSFAIDESVPLYLFGDNDRISQIVYLLFKSSARQLENGKASLQIGAQKNSYATILTFKFTDTTHGYADEDLEALQMFIETGDQSYLEDTNMKGMGYRTIARIVQQLFGQINFEITSDTEMEFLIKIPQLEVEVEELGS